VAGGERETGTRRDEGQVSLRGFEELEIRLIRWLLTVRLLGFAVRRLE
jgi:hypothetical protein